MRAKLAGQNGQEDTGGRSMNWPETPEFEAAVSEEFPAQASEWIDPVSRRAFPEGDGRVDGAGRTRRLHEAAG